MLLDEEHGNAKLAVEPRDLIDTAPICLRSRSEAGVPKIVTNSSASREIQPSRKRRESTRKGRLARRVEWMSPDVVRHREDRERAAVLERARDPVLGDRRGRHAIEASAVERDGAPCAGIVPQIPFSVVVLPDPLDPMIDTNSPRRTVNGERDAVDCLGAFEAAFQVLNCSRNVAHPGLPENAACGVRRGGIPVVVFGPGTTDIAHQAGETVDLLIEDFTG